MKTINTNVSPKESIRKNIDENNTTQEKHVKAERKKGLNS